jgi:hypothetical protein
MLGMDGLRILAGMKTSSFATMGLGAMYLDNLFTNTPTVFPNQMQTQRLALAPMANL